MDDLPANSNSPNNGRAVTTPLCSFRANFGSPDPEGTLLTTSKLKGYSKKDDCDGVRDLRENTTAEVKPWKAR
jgi:hypothetical protein